MRNIIRACTLILALFVCAAVRLSAQDPNFEPIDINVLTPQTLFDSTVEPLYAIVVILSGYLSAFIPGVKKLAPFYRVAAFALAAGLGFHLFGVSFWKIASTYLLSSNLYAVILKNIFKSGKAAGA